MQDLYFEIMSCITGTLCILLSETRPQFYLAHTHMPSYSPTFMATVVCGYEDRDLVQKDTWW